MTKALMLKTLTAEMKSYQGFKWPKKGVVKAPDWNPEPQCGGGLHGLPWGEGDGGLLDWRPNAVWLVAEYSESDAVDLSGKIKVPRCRVVHVGDRQTATEFLQNNGGICRMIAGGTATAGYEGTATVGYRGTATAGYEGTATAGDRGTATAGNEGLISIIYHDDKQYRRVIGVIGKDGLKEKVPYKVKDGKLVEVKQK